MSVIGAAMLGVAAGAAAERYGLTLPGISVVRGAMQDRDSNIEQQAFNKARAYLIQEEGRRNTVYLDSLGKPTVGIGHLVVPSDNLKVGDTISNARVDQFFAKDIDKAFKAAIEQAVELNRYNVDMIARLTSVNFQLGTGWRRKFPNTWSLLKSGRKDSAIRALQKSDWMKQTPNRVLAFINTINTQFS